MRQKAILHIALSPALRLKVLSFHRKGVLSLEIRALLNAVVAEITAVCFVLRSVSTVLSVATFNS
jgi:hypothetical protein